VAVQHLGQSFVWITLAAVLLLCSHVPDGRTQGDVAPPVPGEREAPSPPPTPREQEAPSPPPTPSTGVLFGIVTTTRPPTPGPGEKGVPGPTPGGSSVPVAVARVGIAPVGSSHIWWVVTSVDGGFAIRVPAGTYQVTMEARPGMGVAKNLPATVTIEAGQQTRLDIHLDPGIR
jgi:hypothetical protein